MTPVVVTYDAAGDKHYDVCRPGRECQQCQECAPVAASCTQCGEAKCVCPNWEVR